MTCRVLVTFCLSNSSFPPGSRSDGDLVAAPWRYKKRYLSYGTFPLSNVKTERDLRRPRTQKVFLKPYPAKIIQLDYVHPGVGNLTSKILGIKIIFFRDIKEQKKLYPRCIVQNQQFSISSSFLNKHVQG